MIIQGQPVDSRILNIEKSIANNLQNKNLFQSDNKDTADNVIELKPPIPMKDCLFVFENSSHVAKSCRILAADIIYNDITLTLDQIEEPSEHLVNQVNTINTFIHDNIDELYNFDAEVCYLKQMGREQLALWLIDNKVKVLKADINTTDKDAIFEAVSIPDDAHIETYLSNQKGLILNYIAPSELIKFPYHVWINTTLK